MKKLDWIIAGILSAGVVALAFLFAYPALHPGVWSYMASAAGLRVSPSPFPAAWQGLGRIIFLIFGTTGGIFIMGVVGKLMLGAMVGMVYYLVFNIAIGVRNVDERGPLYIRNVRWAAVLAALSLGFSEPAWKAAQNFSPELLFGFMVLLAAFFLMRALELERFAPLQKAMFISGVLLVENPIGLLVVLGIVVAYVKYGKGFLSDKPDDLATEVSSSEIIQQKWRMLFAGFSGAFLTLALAVGIFVVTGADQAYELGENPARWVFFLIMNWAGGLLSGMTSVGFVMAMLVVFLPGITIFFNIGRSLAAENDFGFGIGMLQIAAAGLALTQLMGFAPFWAANWGDQPLLSSPSLMMLMVILCAVVLGLALMAWGSNRAMNEHKGIGYPAVIVVLVLFCLAGRGSFELRGTLANLDRYVDMVVSEAEGSKLLITDGHFDDALRLKISKRKLDLPLVSFTARGVDLKEFIETIPGVVDSLAVREGVPVLLTTWVKSGRSEGICAQMGFDCWKRSLKPVPPAGGMVVREWPDDARRKAAVQASKDFGEKLRRAHLHDHKRDRVVRTQVEYVLWRLARIASRRAEEAAVAENDVLAAEESDLVDRLENANASAVKFRERLRQARMRMRIVTPEETMRQALDRGDYSLASVYAERLVKENPKNATAWFAMAMNQAGLGELVRAEDYLSQYLQVRPGDPVVLNNRAMVRLSMGKYQAALADAEIAVKKLPHMAEVRNTLTRIQTAIKVVSTNGVPEAVPLPKL